MKTLFKGLLLFAVALFSLPTYAMMPIRAAFQQTGTGTITTANLAGTSGAMTAGSFVNAALGSGTNIVTVTVTGTYTGQLALYTTNDGTNRIAVPFGGLVNVATGDTKGIPANGTGTWTFTASGATASVVATSLGSGSATVIVRPGPAYGVGAPGVSPVGSPTSITQSPLPWQYVFTDISGGGSTVRVEVFDSSGVTQPLTTAGGTKYGAVTISIGASASLSLGYGILTATTVAGSSVTIASLPSTAVGARVTLATGSVAFNTAGTTDGTVGGGGGVLSTLAAPNSDSPSKLLLGDVWTFGRKL